MEFLFIWFIVMIIALIVIKPVARVYYRNKYKAARSASLAALEVLETKVIESGFIIGKKIFLCNTGLYVNDINKQFCVTAEKDDGIKVYPYSALIDFEVFEDGESILQGKSMEAFIGSQLLGTAGAVIGASGSRKVQKIVNRIEVIMRLNDFNNSLITLPVLCTAVNKNSTAYENYLTTSRELAAMLTYIMKNA